MESLRYSGDLKIEDDEFELVAESLIIRESEIAFEFSGHYVDVDDEHYSFRCEGVAKKHQSGHVSGYLAEKIRLVYEGYREDHEEIANIFFIKVEPSDNKGTCKVSGNWMEDKERYSVKGVLDRVD